MSNFFLKTGQIIYRIKRPLLFQFDSERVHNWLTAIGERIGRSKILRSTLQAMWRVESPILEQTFHGIKFSNPIGLSAGFDYEARLTQVLPAIGFGFGTVGTITNNAYEGNPYPRLGRLVKSRSLLVNKGFKNEGIRVIIKKLTGAKFAIPVGISIGKTNGQKEMTQAEAVADVVTTFQIAETNRTAVSFSYYELNISCPNLYGDVEFYSPEHLQDLLTVVTALNLSKPLFIKMPINKSDDETRAMLSIIADHPVAGVIFSNLQTNRNDPSLNQTEVKRYEQGFFSGKPVEKRSNELIALAYKEFGSKLTIIGCGGVFSAEDAYKKVKLGASFIEMITGMVYVGPQLPAQINLGLIKLLKQGGFNNVAQAVGIETKSS